MGNNALPQDPRTENSRIAINNYRETLIKIVKNNSAFSQSLNWKEIDHQLSIRADTMTALASANLLTNYLLSKLKEAGDKHSFLMSKPMAQRYSEGTFVTTMPSAKLLNDNIALINLPALSTSNSQLQKKYATSVQEQIKKLDVENNIVGWIVDLRGNSGGAMYPMIAGLGPLLGSGKLGYYVTYKNGKGTVYTPWYYHNGASGLGKSTFIKVDQPYKLRQKPKVALLIGSLTSSAGEMIAISLSGAKNSRLIGQPSGGYVTGNHPFELPDGSKLYLAMSFSANRNKYVFKDKLIPDDVVESGKDNTEIGVAMKWIYALPANNQIN